MVRTVQTQGCEGGASAGHSRCLTVDGKEAEEILTETSLIFPILYL